MKDHQKIANYLDWIKRDDDPLSLARHCHQSLVNSPSPAHDQWVWIAAVANLVAELERNR